MASEVLDHILLVKAVTESTQVQEEEKETSSFHNSGSRIRENPYSSCWKHNLPPVEQRVQKGDCMSSLEDVDLEADLEIN